MDEFGKYIYADEIMTDFIGTNLENLINDGWLNYIYTENLSEYYQEYKELIKKQLPLNFKIRIMHNSGEHDG